VSVVLKPIVLLLLLLVAIAFESTQPATINNDVVPHLDKIAHFIVFGGVAWLLASSISRRYRWLESTITVVFISLIWVFFLGVADEWIQSFTVGRHAEMNDVLADVAGGAVFLLLYLGFHKRIHLKKETGDAQGMNNV